MVPNHARDSDLCATVLKRLESIFVGSWVKPSRLRAWWRIEHGRLFFRLQYWKLCFRPQNSLASSTCEPDITPQSLIRNEDGKNSPSLLLPIAFAWLREPSSGSLRNHFHLPRNDLAGAISLNYSQLLLPLRNYKPRSRGGREQDCKSANQVSKNWSLLIIKSLSIW